MLKIREKYACFILFFIAVLIGCSGPKPDKKKAKRQKREDLIVHNALPKEVKYSRENLSSIEKIELGRLLFYDPILSGNKDVACATCHHPNNGYAEFRDLSIGVNGKGFGSKRVFNQPNDIPFVKRNANTILNTAFNGIDSLNNYLPEDAPMFWDLRAKSLEAQAILPILAFEEMRGKNFAEDEILNEVIKRLKSIPEYAASFQKAFKEEDPINEKNIGKAIAAFERTLITTESRFDKFMRGDKDAISLGEKEGFRLFKKVGCSNCHSGSMFSDYKPHVLGVPKNEKLKEYDRGIDDDFAFRTASLRNLRFTAPYMHNGKFETIEEVLEFYDEIRNTNFRHEEVSQKQIDNLAFDLTMSIKDIGPIISFLNTLNDEDFDKEIPENVPSGLLVGGNIH